MGPGIEAVVKLLTDMGLSTTLLYIPGVALQSFWNRYPDDFEDEINLRVLTSLKFEGHRFLFTGDMECDGFTHRLHRSIALQALVPEIEMFIAPHHGRENGICPALFDNYGCQPKLVIICDDYMQYDTLEIRTNYRDKATGQPFKTDGKTRYVLTTRSDGTIDLIPSSVGLFVF